MLFIISSNDPQRSNLVGTWLVSTWATLSGETDKNLDSLMKIIDSEKNDELVGGNLETQETIKNEALNESDITRSSSWTTNIEEEVSQEDKNEKWFFARLFGRDDDESESDNTLDDINTTMTWSQDKVSEISVNQSNTSTWTSKISDEITTTEVNKISTTTNIVKSISERNTTTYKNTVEIHPGLNLETAIWKSYEIGVTMLKLNNKNFNKTLALMNKWDVVTQLTQENQYGCFEVELAVNQQKWYVCKKYLSEVSDSKISVTKQENNDLMQPIKVQQWTIVQQDEAIIPTITTPVGSYYKIAIPNPSFFDVILERFTLSQGDILKQISWVNKSNGCVDMKVVGTNSGEHDGKIVSICSPDMVTPIN